VAAWIFWISAALVAYPFAGYPLALFLLRLLFRHEIQRGDIEPPVSLLIPAYNEAAVIEAKIENALSLDYPPEKLEIAIASDGSKDSTVALARACAERLAAGDRIRIFDYPVNRGKIVALNDTVPQLRGELIVFSDTSAIFAPQALRRLVSNFADPKVGAAGGVYRIRSEDSSPTGAQERFYWLYESFLKRAEASLGSTLGAHGQIYAVRKHLYPFPPPGTINDDWVIPVRIAQRGCRVAYDPSAVAYEEAHEMSGFGRHVRIMAGNVQQMKELRGFLRPPRPLCVFFFLSHKGLRLVAPFAMLAALAANFLLVSEPLYRVLLAAQLAFYALAALGGIWKLQPKPLRLPFYFCRVNAAAFFGVFHALTGRRRMSWS
jgi:glycosyltransferase involved in cell wall biosynthesis